MAQKPTYSLSGNTAEFYERNMVRRIFMPWAHVLVDAAAPAPGERLLDLACGTGAVTRLAAKAAGSTSRLTGLDNNGAMLEVADRLARQDGLDIELVAASATDTGLPDGAFDVITCQQGLQFFPDKPAAAAEMKRMLAPGGRIALAVWRPIDYAPGHHAVADAVAKFIGSEAAASRYGPFELNDRETLRALFAGAGFKDVHLRIASTLVRFESGEHLVRCMMEGTPLAPLMADAAPDKVAGVIAMAEDRVAAYVDDDGVALPMQSWIITARA